MSPETAIRWGAWTDVGPYRETNEDHFAGILLSAGAAFFVVADGLGGHEAGEVASHLAVDEARNAVARGWSDALSPEEVEDLLGLAFETANRKVLEEARRADNDMGTTFTALLLEGGRAHVVHVGDSRAYLLSEGALQLLTSDHTLAASDPHDRSDPKSHVLTRCIGIDERIAADLCAFDVQPADRFLLCTDGLWEAFEAEPLCALASAPKDPESVCRRLVEEAGLRGGTDNATALLVELAAGPEGSVHP